jgi:hypothetical protein
VKDNRPGDKPEHRGDRVESSAAQVELRWRRHRLNQIKLELDVMDGPVVSEGAAGGIRYAIQEDRGVKLRVASGTGSDLASWRGAYASRVTRFGSERRVTVCGRAARRQEADVASESATGSHRAEDGTIEHINADRPAVFAVAVAFTIAGEQVLVEWVVPAATRERYRSAEKRFLDSLVCL